MRTGTGLSRLPDVLSPPRLPLRVLRWTGLCQRQRLFALSNPAQAGLEPQRSAPGGLIWLRRSSRTLGAARRETAAPPRLPLRVLRWHAALLLVLAQLVPSAHAADEFSLIIAPGDTLIGISQRLLDNPARWPELKRLNRLKYETRLKPGSHLRIPLDWLRWAERTALVIHVQGVVMGTVSAANVPLAVGMQLKAGDSFDTGARGALSLRLAEGSTVVFAPQTQAALARSREVPGTGVQATTIDLKNGSVDSTVAPLRNPASRFEVRTPRVVTAVRGTRFRVTADGDASRHEVVTGAVGVTGVEPGRIAGETSLKEVQGLRAEGGSLGAAVPLLPAADVSGVPGRVERIAQIVGVPPLAGALGWRWQVASDAAFSRLLQDERTPAPNWLMTGLPDGDYHLRVRAADAQQLEGLEAQQAFALRARPEPPVLRAPGPGASVAGPSDMVWAEAMDAPAYQVQVARDARFADLVLDRAPVVGPRLAIDPAWPPGRYHWRVATLRAAGAQGPFAEGPRGPFGDAADFTVLPPSVMEPPQIGANGLQLAWSGPVGFSHKVQLAGDAGFASPQFDQVVPGTRLDLPTPAAGTYFVRTQVVLPDGRVGAWSSPQKFEVPRTYPWGLLLLLLPLL